MKTPAQAFKLFIGIALMLFCATIALVIERDFKVVLLVQHLGVGTIPFLKLASTLCTIVVGIILIFLSWGGNVNRAFYPFFSFNALFFGSLAGLEFAGSSVAQQPLLIQAFYVWASVSALVAIALIWGYANQKYTFKLAALHYPFLLMLGVFSMVYGTLLITRNIAMQSEHIFSIVCTCLFALNVIILIIYWLMSRSDLGPVEQGFNFSWGYVFALALLAFGIKYGANISELLFKAHLKEMYPGIQEFQAFMGQYSAYKGATEIVLLLIGIAAGLALYFLGIKWLAPLGIVILIAMAITGLPAFFPAKFWPITLYVLFGSLLGTLFQLVKEWFYFGIDIKRRFSAKLGIDVILLALASTLANYTNISLITLSSKPILENVPLFATLFGSAVALGLGGLFYMNRSLKQGSSLQDVVLPDSKPVAKQFSVTELIGEGWRRMKANWVSLVLFQIAALLVYTLANFGPMLFLRKDSSLFLVFTVMFIQMIIGLLLSIAYYHMSLKIIRNDKVEVSDLFKRSDRLINYFVASLLYGVVILVGFLFFIIPGIYLAVRLGLFGFYIVDQDAGPIRALEQSWKAVHGAWWKVLGFAILCLLINVLGALCLLVGLLFTIPTAWIAFAALYRTLENQENQNVATNSPLPKPEA